MYRIYKKEIETKKLFFFMECKTLRDAEEAVFAAQCEDDDYSGYSKYSYIIFSPDGKEII